MTKSYKAVDTLAPPPQTKILATPLSGGVGGGGGGGVGGGGGHPHACGKRNTQECKNIDSIHNTMMAKDRHKKGDGGWENKFRS